MNALHLTFAAAAALASLTTQAAPITSSSDAALAGASTINFDNQTAGKYTNLSIDDVSFTAIDNDFSIANQYAGSFNTNGMYLDNSDYSSNGFDSLRIDFTNSTDAFGFNWGASNNDWLLTGFDASGSALDAITLPEVKSANNGEFFGLSGFDFDYAILSTTAVGYDWILIDNFTYQANSSSVPEPGSLALLGLGLAGLGMTRRKKQA